MCMCLYAHVFVHVDGITKKRTAAQYVALECDEERSCAKASKRDSKQITETELFQHQQTKKT